MFLEADPNLKTLCIRHSGTFPFFEKKKKKFVKPEKLKKCIWAGVPSCSWSFVLEALKCPFSKFGVLLIYSYKFLFFINPITFVLILSRNFNLTSK